MSKECVPIYCDGIYRQNAESYRTAATKVSTDASSINNNSQSKESSRWKLKISRIRDIFKLPSTFDRRRSNPLSGLQLRKKLTKLASKGDWDALRKLLSDYELPTIALEDSSVPPNPTTSTSTNTFIRRRRRSSSYLAAAVIQAGTLDEESESNSYDKKKNDNVHIINASENILRDVCRCNPPLDIVETLLFAFRHRCCGSTLLEIAGTSGASPEVNDALIPADKIEAQMRRKQEDGVNDAPFDMLGITRCTVDPPAISQEPPVDETSNNKIRLEPQQKVQMEMTDDDIYQQYLLDYLYDSADDLKGCKNLDYADEDSFDILDDPSVAEHNEPSLMIDESSLIYVKESDSTHPLFVVICDDEESVSVL